MVDCRRSAALDILRRAPEKARQKVLADRLFPLVKKSNETLAHPITGIPYHFNFVVCLSVIMIHIVFRCCTGKLVCLPIEEVFELLMSPPLLAQRVHDLGAKLKRYTTQHNTHTLPSIKYVLVID